MRHIIPIAIMFVFLALCGFVVPAQRNNAVRNDVATYSVVFVTNYGNSTNMMGWWTKTFENPFNYYLVNNSVIEISVVNRSTENATAYLHIKIFTNNSTFGDVDVTTNDTAINLNLGVWDVLELGFVISVPWNNIENVCKNNNFSYVDQGRTVTIELVYGTQRTTLIYEKRTGLLVYGYGEFTGTSTNKLEIVRTSPQFVEEPSPPMIEYILLSIIVTAAATVALTFFATRKFFK
ncbi:MAG: hypothetical protein QXL15_00320 [Candidatus Korarchaeota archaeon]